ncbi:putative bifunctional diguanylate cyclase/phosphodiesterase [Oceanisphaera sp.]|uniref:putative bifunctional diguanylate cyclase/phosphodiesterase n=1 Tax=Oceanisphaera sp. TaxID=1929979 RepID=UPI003A8D225F
MDRDKHNRSRFLPAFAYKWLPQKLSKVARPLYKALILVFLLAAGTWLVYFSGGTSFAFPYVLLLPVLLSASWFGLPGAILCSITAALLIGPWMPVDVSAGTDQITRTWLTRIAFFLMIGAFAAWLFRRLRQANQRYLQALNIDQKTGLLTQAALTQDLEKLLQSSSRDNASPSALLLLRMEDLWEVLQSMGVDTAEQVVKDIALRINNKLQVPHQIYRYSRSELAIILPDCTQDKVGSVFKVVQQVGDNQSTVNGISLRVQFVAGSYLIGENDDNTNTVINHARTGLSAAIEHHVPYLPYDPAFDQHIAERVQLIGKVRDGLVNQEFQLFYQPKICLQTGQHLGAEALLRWFNPENKMIMPGLFIPKVESTTLIDPVTRFVIARACEDIKSQQLASVSLNFAVRNLMDQSLISELGKMVSSYGVTPESLEIEITEGALIQNPEQAKAAVDSLREQGFKVSLDDFGTGYSSFQYLAQLPLSGLKIDRAFVIDLETSANARTIMASMISMARALKLEVTVEGIETEAQRKMVTDMGAELAQGFYYSRPLPLSEYQLWAKDYCHQQELSSRYRDEAKV